LAFSLAPARFDEDLDFLRLAFFMNSSRSIKFVQLCPFLRSVARAVCVRRTRGRGREAAAAQFG
jgi:hypothetical protein